MGKNRTVIVCLDSKEHKAQVLSKALGCDVRSGWTLIVGRLVAVVMPMDRTSIECHLKIDQHVGIIMDLLTNGLAKFMPMYNKDGGISHFQLLSK